MAQSTTARHTTLVLSRLNVAAQTMWVGPGSDAVWAVCPFQLLVFHVDAETASGTACTTAACIYISLTAVHFVVFCVAVVALVLLSLI